jgi:hypothetical protein
MTQRGWKALAEQDFMSVLCEKMDMPNAATCDTTARIKRAGWMQLALPK